jgi:hypothetical protein
MLTNLFQGSFSFTHLLSFCYEIQYHINKKHEHTENAKIYNRLNMGSLWKCQ